MNRAPLAAVAAFVAVFPAFAVPAALVAQAQPAEWTQEQAPVRIFGDTYYVGTRGLSTLLPSSGRVGRASRRHHSLRRQHDGATPFKFSSSRTYPRAVSDFEKSVAFLRKTPCDLLLTPHPDASGLWARVAKREAGDKNGLIERGHCDRYANRAEAGASGGLPNSVVVEADLLGRPS